MRSNRNGSSCCRPAPTHEASCASTPSSWASTATSSQANTTCASRLWKQNRSPPSQPGIAVTRWLGELPLTWVGALAAVAVLAGVAVWQLGRSAGTGTVRPTRPRATQTRTQPRTHAHHPVTTAKPLPGRPPPLLALTAARGSCWLSVRIGSSVGPTAYEQTLQQGQTARFGLRKPLWLRLGAPWNLDATIGRRPVTTALPARTGDMLATAGGLRPT